MCAAHDLDTHTHILYLNISPSLIAQPRYDDRGRYRPAVSVRHLENRQYVVMTELRRLCREHKILFCALSRQATLVVEAARLLRDIDVHTEMYNMSLSRSALDGMLGPYKRPQTMLVLAGKALTTENMTQLF